MILFVDDEPRYSQRYLEELRRAYVVEYMGDADLAAHFLSDPEEAAAVELLIIDLMMPHTRRFGEEETRCGLDTGLRLYERVRAQRPSLPVIVLTNVSEEAVIRRFNDEPNCRFRRKRDCLPTELVRLVGETLRESGGLPVVM
jgi:DNA-binding NarL/FixJ family response regulator